MTRDEGLLLQSTVDKSLVSASEIQTAHIKKTANSNGEPKHLR